MLQGVDSIRAIQANDSKITPASLPLDIWIEIALTLAVEDGHFRNVIPLLAVCKLLRSALHQIHQLWTSLDFNYRDQPSRRKFPVPKYESIRLFLNSLSADSVQSIRWRPSNSEDMDHIIQFTLHKFDAIEVLDVRPHSGISTTKHLLAAYTAIRSLHKMNIRCTKLRALMIANTSWRQEIVKYEHDTAMIIMLQRELECLADVQYDKDGLRSGKTKDKIIAHDVAICEMCDSQFALASGNRTCTMEARKEKFKACYSCTGYCSVCVEQIYSDHHPEDWGETGEDYETDEDYETLGYCSQDEDTDICINCCVQCPVCSRWYCEVCRTSEEHEMFHSKNGYPRLTWLFRL